MRHSLALGAGMARWSLARLRHGNSQAARYVYSGCPRPFNGVRQVKPGYYTSRNVVVQHRAGQQLLPNENSA